ncbi:hypothetical protein [Pelagibaculum spongiae]|uniref:Uncharacterized protein n=1 Tax=Pelagibaculum spongiae TaxID=2080658 RepID=A0A2V1GT27_9GAMM|nr:hypothetical protein [Pelagibaculum spongiae]PVZ65661.1 hypothetical protein DC094_17395 [Pelagibaculum spongiae]
MTLKPFKLGKLDPFNDFDSAKEALEAWLVEFSGLYLASVEYNKLSKVNKKQQGQWFAFFMDLSLGYIAKDLNKLDLDDVQEIMMDLIPRKLICSDTQAKTIVPDILAAWQFLDRTFNSGPTKKLKHATEIIAFLTSIKRDYLKIYNHDPSSFSSPFDLLDEDDFETDFDLSTNDLLEQFENDRWIIDLIESTAKNINKKTNILEISEWSTLLEFDPLDNFISFICCAGINEEIEHCQQAMVQLLEYSLQNLFMLIRQKDASAIEFWQATEKNLILAFEHDNLNAHSTSLFMSVLAQYKSFLSENFVDFIKNYSIETVEDLSSGEMTPEVLDNLFIEIDNNTEDEFELANLLSTELAFLPPEGFEILCSVFVDSGAKASNALALSVLNDDIEQAKVAISILNQQPGKLPPASLSRLIQVRNWLADPLKKPVDQLIKNAKKKGVSSLSSILFSKENIVDCHMSAVDGSGAQGVMITLRDHDKFRLVALVFKQNLGIVDVSISPPLTNTFIKQHIKMAKDSIGALEKVSVDLIRKQLPIFISLNKSSNTAIDFNLVQAMELIGATDWNPTEETLTSLCDQSLLTEPTSAEIVTAKKAVARWVDSDLGSSWFEMLRPGTKQHHSEWAERMLRMALWCQFSASKRRQNQARNFAVVSWLFQNSKKPILKN